MNFSRPRGEANCRPRTGSLPAGPASETDMGSQVGGETGEGRGSDRDLQFQGWSQGEFVLLGGNLI